MNASWFPVILVDVFGSVATLIIAVLCFWHSWQWKNNEPDNTFRYYIFFLTASIVLFAVSRSMGHLVKQCLLYFDMNYIWKEIAPFSGSINTATFIIIFTISIYFQLQWKTHKQLQEYKNHLEDLVESLKSKSAVLEASHKELKASQSQLLQQEKMASIGQLAAGVAHEINNPVGFVTSNLGTLNKYTQRLAEYITALSESINNSGSYTEENLRSLRKKLKIDYAIEDSVDLIKESLDGVERVKTIVQNLKSFSRVDQTKHIEADINQCLEDTLNIVWNELKYKTTVTKHYGKLPLTKCHPQQLNQVFMNLLVNAAHAIEKQGEITIKTWSDDDSIYVSIADTGCGVPEKYINKLFEPFFTTKEVGKGTGLGLSIAYDIITKKHGGEITVESEVDKGTTFTIELPVVEDFVKDAGKTKESH